MFQKLIVSLSISLQSRLTLRVIAALGLFLIFWSNPAESKRRLHHEKIYQKLWCEKAGGRTEVTLNDKSRVDCLTNDYAIEFDFGFKWREAIRQSLHYSNQTGKQPGIVLILERGIDTKYWVSLNNFINQKNLKIKTWKMKPEDL